MAYLALYRKYRPRDFDSVVGQAYVTRILRNQILSDRVGHAYLFSGIRGTGKTSTAKIFARAINCEHPVNGNPCNTCETCQKIEKSGTMGIIEIDGASNRGVDEIREIREKAKFPPTIGKYKVYIIDEVHMLTKEAFNALLKTLEEPPAHVVFILATTEPARLPATILSRCQRFDIKPISQADIAGQIKKILADIHVEMEEDAVQLIANRGDSSMRDALSLLDQVIDIQHDGQAITEAEVLDFLGMADDESIYQLTQAIFDGDKGKALKVFKSLRDLGRDSTLIYDQLTEMLRRVLIVRSAGAESAEILGVSEKALTGVKQLAEGVDTAALFKMISLMIEERSRLKYSALTGVVVEMLLLKLCMTVSGEVLEEAFISPSVREASASLRSSKRVTSRPTVIEALQNTASGEKVLSDTEPIALKDAKTPETFVKSETVAAEVVTDTDHHTEDTLSEQIDGFGAEGQQTVQPEDGLDQVSQADSSGAKKAYRGVNTDKLYRFLIQVCQQHKPMAVPSLQKGRLSEIGEKSLALRFNPDQRAAVALLNLPDNLEFLKHAVNQAMKEPYALKIEVVEKSYEEMTMAEKTRSILEHQPVEVVEVD